VQVINAENNLNLSVLQLKQVLQIPGEQEFEIEVPEIDLNVEDNPLEGLTAQDIYNIAMGEMPEIKSGDLGVESADLGIKIAKAQLYPSLRMNGNLNTNYSSARQNQFIITETVDPFQIGTVNFDPTQPVYTLPSSRQALSSSESYPVVDQWADNIGRSISVTLSVPIFNGLAASSNIQRSRITRRQAEITSQERKNSLRQSIERAYNDVLGAGRSYDQSLKQVEAQTESFRVTQRSYELGAMNFIDFQVGQNNLFEARTNLLLAKYDYIFKLKILDFYQGNPLEF
jgi:outer membrane protein